VRAWASFGLEQQRAVATGGGKTRRAEEGCLKLVSLQASDHVKKLLSQVKNPILDAE